MRGRKRIQVIFTTDSFTGALERFYTQIKLVSTRRKGVKPDLLLVGQFRNQPFKLDVVGFPERGTGLLIYIANAVLDKISQCNAYTINLAHDISLPIIIKQGLVVKYDIIKGKLDFFDSYLRKIQPGGSFDYHELTFFAYHQPIKVINI